MPKNLIDFAASQTSGASPGASPYYNRTFWASYKGQARGQLAGIFLGAIGGLGIGLILGGIAAVAASALGFTAVGPLAVLGIVAAASTAVGAKYYYGMMRDIGNVSGAISAAMEVNEERSRVINIKLDTLLNVLAREDRLSKDEVNKIQDAVESVYQEGEAKYEKRFFRKPAVIWQVAAVGALAGMALVAAIGTAGYLFLGEQIGHTLATTLGEHVSSAVIAGLGLAGGALTGASYGINRDLMRPLVNFTNALFEGDLKEYSRQVEQQKVIPVETNLDANIVAVNGNGHAKQASSPDRPTPRITGAGTVLLGSDSPYAHVKANAADVAVSDFRERLEQQREQDATASKTLH